MVYVTLIKQFISRDSLSILQCTQYLGYYQNFLFPERVDICRQVALNLILNVRKFMERPLKTT